MNLLEISKDPIVNMSSIITITFSPAIDKSTSIHALIPEKKIKCSQPKLEPGGGGINVARAIRKLGGDALAIYPAGGYSGKYFQKLMEDEHIRCGVVETKAETRENLIVFDESSGMQYRFGMPGTHLQPQECDEIVSMLKKETGVQFVIVSGSMPPGVSPDIITEIGKICETIKARLIVDSTGEALVKAAAAGVFLMKPNLSELSSLVGKKSIELEEVDDAAREVIARGNAEAVVVSMGPSGALLVTKDKEKQFVPPKVITKSTVGAGDSMVAGIVHSIVNGSDLENAVCFGVACGTAATMNPGTELFKKEDAERIFNYIRKNTH